MKKKSALLELINEFEGLRQVVLLCLNGSLDMAMTRLGKTLEEMLRMLLLAHGVVPKENAALDALLGMYKEHVDADPRLLTHAHALRGFRNAATHTSAQFRTEDVHNALVSFLAVVSSSTFLERFEREARVAERALVYLNGHPRALEDTERVIERIQYFDTVERIYEVLHQGVLEEVAESGHVTIENLGLDHETVWPYLRDSILGAKNVRSVTCRMLIVDPEDERIREMSSEQVSVEMASLVLQKWRRYSERYGQELAERDVRVEYRRNPILPVVHGFALNRRKLFWSLCRLDAGRYLRGGDGFYHYCRADPDDPVISHYFDVFGDWFDYSWAVARPA